MRVSPAKIKTLREMRTAGFRDAAFWERTDVFMRELVESGFALRSKGRIQQSPNAEYAITALGAKYIDNLDLGQRALTRSIIKRLSRVEYAALKEFFQNEAEK